MMHLHGGRGGGLNLRWGCSGRWPRSLSRSGRGEVRLLLARVQHHRRRGGSSSGRRGVLLYWVHGGGRAGVLEVMLTRVVMVVEVGGWMEMGQLVVMVRVMRCHCRGAAVVRSHHFRGIGSRRSAKSHSLTQQPEMRGGKTKKEVNEMEREAAKMSNSHLAVIEPKDGSNQSINVRHTPR